MEICPLKCERNTVLQQFWQYLGLNLCSVRKLCFMLTRPKIGQFLFLRGSFWLLLKCFLKSPPPPIWHHPQQGTNGDWKFVGPSPIKNIEKPPAFPKFNQIALAIYLTANDIFPASIYWAGLYSMYRAASHLLMGWLSEAVGILNGTHW